MEWNKINSFSDYDHYKRLHRIKGQNTDLLVTDGHGLIDFEGKTPRLFKAKDFDQRARTKFRLAGLMERDGIEYSDLQIRLIVQVAADGSLENNGKADRFHLKKKRKIDRLESLLKDLGIPYSINPSKSKLVGYSPTPFFSKSNSCLVLKISYNLSESYSEFAPLITDMVP